MSIRLCDEQAEANLTGTVTRDVNLDLEIAYSYLQRGRCHSWTAARPIERKERKIKKKRKRRPISRKKSVRDISVNRWLCRREYKISIVNQTAPAGSLCRFWKSPQGFAARANFAFHRWLLPCTAADYHESSAHAVKLKLKSSPMSGDNDNEPRRRC